MKLWKKAAGALKDQNSLLITALSRRTHLRSPDLEAAVIKATSHDEARVDYRNAQRVFAWARTSPSTHLKPLVWAISSRAHRTRSWPVALKCLMLLHGVFCCKVPAVHRIGRLPFDLSDFADAHSSPSKTWGHNALVRAYFNFLDHKSSFLYTDLKEIRKVKLAGPEESIMAEIVMLQRLQSLLTLLLQVRPQAEGMRGTLVLEAMDCVIIEIFDTYSKVCNLIARVLSRIYGASQAEASMALLVLRQANSQGDELAEFFDFCKFYGVLNASEFPKVERIPEEDFREVERMVYAGVEEESKAIVVSESGGGGSVLVQSSGKVLTTVVTNKWEIFDDDLKSLNGGNGTEWGIVSVRSSDDPQPQRQPPHVYAYKLEIPDLITF
ncbi:putative clathrin assembly protein At1g25240 [Rhodamnia argentea]|uniref:Clathrin assembly protein At1g25240 n=1 Tax=Rhodamnia argentea TaxID=178133 RepID=A0A8B8QZ94_9MYRT|nr:putative clathrin assembly protein At1g25240 [Rhodamnia argentea]